MTGKTPLIIDQPTLVPLPRRFGWGCVTATFWCVWIYLWIPFVTLAAWGFGLYQGYSHLRWAEELAELKRLLILYTVIIGLMGSLLLAWAFLEYVRFRNRRRRSSSASVTQQELAVYAGLPPDAVASWHAARCLVAYHDEHGMLVGADCRSEVAQEPGADAIARAASTPLLVADSSVAG